MFGTPDSSLTHAMKRRISRRRGWEVTRHCEVQLVRQELVFVTLIFCSVFLYLQPMTVHNLWAFFNFLKRNISSLIRHESSRRKFNVKSLYQARLSRFHGRSFLSECTKGDGYSLHAYCYRVWTFYQQSPWLKIFSGASVIIKIQRKWSEIRTPNLNHSLTRN